MVARSTTTTGAGTTSSKVHEVQISTDTKDRIVARVFPPEGPTASRGPWPTIVMAHGMGALAHWGLDAFAQIFQRHGYAVVLFDYRHFGKSQGEPRNHLWASKQLADYRFVLAYIRARDDQFDRTRLVAWGTSFSGAHVTYLAATDPEICACIIQNPLTDGFKASLMGPLKTSLSLGFWAFLDVVKSVTMGGDPIYCTRSAQPGTFGFLSSEDAVSGFQRIIPAEEHDSNRLTARSAFGILVYRPVRVAHKATMPLLCCIPDADRLVPVDSALKVAISAPRGELFRVPGHHFDCYAGQMGFEANMRAQLSFLARHVPIAPLAKL